MVKQTQPPETQQRPDELQPEIESVTSSASRDTNRLWMVEEEGK